MATWVVDAFNVIGCRPDGWWRDRPGAVLALVRQVQRWTAREGVPCVVVVDGRPAPDLPEGMHAGVLVLYDRHADDRIVAWVAAHAAGEPVRVVTGDRALQARLAPHGAILEGPGHFRTLLEGA